MLKKFLTLTLANLLLAPPLLICRAETNPPPEVEKQSATGDLEKARQAFKDQLNQDENSNKLSPAFFYNYGTTLAKAGVIGESYVVLLRASFSAPFDGDTRHNLEIVEQQVPAVTRSIRPTTWLSWWPHGLRAIPWQIWLCIALTANALSLILARHFDMSIRVASSGIGMVFFVLTLLSWWQLHSPVYGITGQVKVKSGPGNTYSDIVSLEPGSIVNSETIRDGWLKIRFLKGEIEQENVGWIEPGAVLRIY